MDGATQQHVVVGSGPIGSGIVKLLASAGTPVRVVTRRGTGPALAGVERVAADAADGARLAQLTAGATVIYNCVNPPYHRWASDWPPIARSLLSAAERSGAVLVTVSNLYAYGPAAAALGVEAYDERHPMTEETPLAAISVKGEVRRRMWLDALALHEAGRIRAVEIRSSDYVGSGAQSMIGDRVVPPLLRGGRILIPGRVDRVHTWTYVGDVARLAVAVGGDARAWGRAWHTPSNAPRTIEGALRDLALRAGVRPPRIVAMPHAAVYGLGLVSTLMRELRATQYQFRSDFVMDSSSAQRMFGLRPTPWAEILDAILEARPGDVELARAA